MNYRRIAQWTAILAASLFLCTACAAAQEMLAMPRGDAPLDDGRTLLSAPNPDREAASPAFSQPPKINSNGTVSSSPAFGGTGLQLQGVPGTSVPWSIVVMLTALTLI